MNIKRSIGTLALAALMGSTMLVTTGLTHDSDQTETRSLDEFNRVVIEGAMDVTIEVGKTQSVVVSVDDGYLDRVDTRVDDGTLYISQEGRRWHDADLEISISVQNLDAIHLEGAADIDAIGIDSDDFELTIDGAGDITLIGSCGSGRFEINGAGDIDAADLKCKSVDVTINGAGDVDVYASESAEAELNGVGDISVCGDPDRVRPRIHGLGSFEVDDCD